MLTRFSYTRKLLFFDSFSSDEREIVERNFPFYTSLDKQEKKVFEYRVKRFLKSHRFLGRTIVVTDYMKLLIAATAIQLTFGLKNYLYSLFHTIIIYPSAYRSSITNQFHKGESNPKLGVLVFSWDDFLEGIRIGNDNLNLGLHEFTHALYFSFVKKRKFEAYSFLKNYESLLALFTEKYLESSKKDSYIRAYGFENKFELLSVLVECFFETPKEMKEKYPEIYIRLTEMLQLNLIKKD